MTHPCWHILTGEYPPQPGGVSDYRRALGGRAGGDQGRGSCLDRTGHAPDAVEGITVHRDGGRWSPADLRRLGAALDAFPSPRRLVVQYTPNAWGYRGLNLGFCRWRSAGAGRAATSSA